ncbi:MAG: leucine-rich repeat domain-containing protein [Verrucomicrobiota bacterium]|jgi:hypothetical protein
MKTQTLIPRITCPKTMAGRLGTACATKLLPLLLLLTLPAVAQAQFSYTVNNGAITITGYTGPGGAVTIPSTINGLPVTSIGDWAFYEISSLSSVTIPDSVTNVGRYAFELCTSLPSVTIPNSVTSIGENAFSGCSSLTNVTIGNSVSSIGVAAFNGCTSLPSVTIPHSVTSIGQHAFGSCRILSSVTIPSSITNIADYTFEYCLSLTNVTIPSSVTRIGDDAFLYCISLTSVTIPNSVTSIGHFAFVGCSSLTNVTIPSSVTSIGEDGFDACSSLTSIMVDALNSVYSSVNGVLLDKNQATLIAYPGGRVGTYTIPNSVTNIGGYAFSLCGSLTSVTIPSSVSNIGDWAFEYCASLQGVYFEGSAPRFGLSIFLNDTNVTVYYLPGTSGWGPFFANRPTVLWNPQVQPASFGVRANQFGFSITGSSNLVIVIEASTNLANPTWSPLQTNTLTGDSSYFSDAQWTNYPGRFYRLRWP